LSQSDYDSSVSLYYCFPCLISSYEDIRVPGSFVRLMIRLNHENCLHNSSNGALCHGRQSEVRKLTINISNIIQLRNAYKLHSSKAICFVFCPHDIIAKKPQN
jgi:hypothetical protein